MIKFIKIEIDKFNKFYILYFKFARICEKSVIYDDVLILLHIFYFNVFFILFYSTISLFFVRSHQNLGLNFLSTL